MFRLLTLRHPAIIFQVHGPFLSIFQGGACVPEVYIDEGESFEKALKKFKKKCEKAGILSDLRKTPSF